MSLFYWHILYTVSIVGFFQDECEEQLNIAMPLMNAAIAALDTLKQADITIVKTMTNPPTGVRLVMETICIMKVSTKMKKKNTTLSEQIQNPAHIPGLVQALQ